MIFLDYSANIKLPSSAFLPYLNHVLLYQRSSAAGCCQLSAKPWHHMEICKLKNFFQCFFVLHCKNGQWNQACNLCSSRHAVCSWKHSHIFMNLQLCQWKQYFFPITSLIYKWFKIHVFVCYCISNYWYQRKMTFSYQKNRCAVKLKNDWALQIWVCFSCSLCVLTLDKGLTA